MPKKHQNRALLTKPTSSVPSHFSSSRATSANDHGSKSERSVNDLIRESRRQNYEPTPIDTFALSSLPPSLRAVLNMPTPPPPIPRSHIRGPTRLRRLPGPPPPRSWLTDSRHAPEKSRPEADESWLNTRIQHQSSKLPGGNLPISGTLQHLVLKTMASRLAWHAEYDHTYLSTLPVRIREALLSYIAVYDESHWPNPLPFLFPADSDEDELTEVIRLDLSNAVGTWATVKRIERELVWGSKTVTITPTNNVPNSWDVDEEPLSTPTPTIQSALRFVNLKHLSLAINPGSGSVAGSWPSLLSLASRLSTLTSLSLAHWPQPTYTPNASKGRFKISNDNNSSMPSTTYGGSNFYTAFDNDWREAAGILRSLSRSLYCLKWLDLSGCGDWFPALTWQKPEEDTATTGPDWSGSWRNVETLILAVGWSPGSETDTGSRSDSIKDYQAQDAERINPVIRQSVLDQMSSIRLGNRTETEGQPQWDTEHERRKYYHRKEIERYLSVQESAKQAARIIRALKKSHGGRWIDIEFGEDGETVINT